MNARRLQGLALILSAVCLLIAQVLPKTTVFNVTLLIGGILFILGIPAVYSAQPSGWPGMAGIVLLELAALIPLGFRLDVVPSSLSDSLVLTSIILGGLGRVIIGWLTAREHVFPAWAGWFFLAGGVLNIIAWLFNFGSLAGVLIAVLEAAAVFGYGYFLYQGQRKPQVPTNTK